jgi:hypothetical protein
MTNLNLPFVNNRVLLIFQIIIIPIILVPIKAKMSKYEKEKLSESSKKKKCSELNP